MKARSFAQLFQVEEARRGYAWQSITPDAVFYADKLARWPLGDILTAAVGKSTHFYLASRRCSLFQRNGSARTTDFDSLYDFLAMQLVITARQRTAPRHSS